VITRKSWEAIPPEARDAMLKAAKEAGTQIKTKSRSESNESVATMRNRGLKVQSVTPEIEAEWRKLAEGFYPRFAARSCPQIYSTRWCGCCRSTARASREDGAPRRRRKT